MDGRQCIQRAEALKAERSNLDGFYDLIDNYVVPGRGRMFEGSSGGENSVDWSRRKLYDSTALFAAQTLAASINGSLTSPATRWFTYRFRDPKLNDSSDASEWLEECQERVFYALYESNFSVEASEFYLDAVSFGTPAMAHEYEMEGPNNPKMRFRTLATRDFFFETDFAGNPIGLFQYKEYTAAQVLLEFDAVPDLVKEAYENPSHVDTFEIVHAIYLDHKAKEAYDRTDKSKPAAVESRPYQEKFVLVSSAETLTPKRPTGYYEMPAYVLRWGRTAGSKFGYSPAINALPDILTLNQLVEYDLRAREKAIDPPLVTQQRGVIGDVDLNPGGITVVRDVNMLVPLESRARFDVSEAGMGRLIQSIRTAFFVDQLELKDSPAMTATEVNVRYELMQRLLGPTLSRFKTDYLDPLLQRTFWIMLREGALPEIPEGVSAATLDIEYVGPMARNQKLDEVVAIERLAQAANVLAPLDQRVLDSYKWDKSFKLMGQRLGVPAALENSDKEIKDIQAQRAEAQAKKDQMESMGQMASAMKDGARGAKDLQDAGISPEAMGGAM